MVSRDYGKQCFLWSNLKYLFLVLRFIYLFILLLQFLERSKETFPLKEMIEPGYRFSEYLSDKILEHSADSI